MVSTTNPTQLLIALILITGTTYRATVLIQRDTITAPARDWLVRRYTGSLVTAMTRCPWCLSVWLGAAFTLAAYYWWAPWLVVVMLAATASAVTGILFEKV